MWNKYRMPLVHPVLSITRIGTLSPPLYSSKQTQTIRVTRLSDFFSLFFVQLHTHAALSCMIARKVDWGVSWTLYPLLSTSHKMSSIVSSGP
jgi:hypothetical protein